MDNNGNRISCTLSLGGTPGNWTPTEGDEKLPQGFGPAYIELEVAPLLGGVQLKFNQPVSMAPLTRVSALRLRSELDQLLGPTTDQDAELARGEAVQEYRHPIESKPKPSILMDFLRRLPFIEPALNLRFIPFGGLNPLWPYLREDGVWLCYFDVVLGSLQPPEAEKVNPTKLWMCAVAVDNNDDLVTVANIEKAIENCRSRKGWTLVSLDGGGIPKAKRDGKTGRVLSEFLKPRTVN